MVTVRNPERKHVTLTREFKNLGICGELIPDSVDQRMEQLTAALFRFVNRRAQKQSKHLEYKKKSQLNVTITLVIVLQIIYQMKVSNQNNYSI